MLLGLVPIFSTNFRLQIESIDMKLIFGILLDFMDVVQKANQSTISQRDTNGLIPLHYAAKFGHIEVFRVLLSYDISLVLVKDKKRQICHAHFSKKWP